MLFTCLGELVVCFLYIEPEVVLKFSFFFFVLLDVHGGVLLLNQSAIQWIDSSLEGDSLMGM